MSPPDPPSPEWAALSAALRAARRKRGLKAREVAAAMHLPLRTYQMFEAGRSQVDLLPRIRAFAQATDGDPHGILIAMALGVPELAVHSLDNKFVSVLLVAARRFDERLGDRLARFEVGRLIAAFRKAFDELEAELETREAAARDWFDPPPEDT